MNDAERPIDRIAPDFAERWDADSAEAALAKAEAASSSTPKSKMPRCVACGSVQVTPKPGGFSDMDHRVDNAYKCQTCGHHADERAQPAADAPDYDSPKNEDANDDVPDDSKPEPIMPRHLKIAIETYRIPTAHDLRQLREALGLSRRDVSVAHYGTIRRWEQEETSPKVGRLAELVEWYRTVDAARRAERLNTILGAIDVEPVPQEEPSTPDPFEWVDEPQVRAATDGGR